MLRWTPKRTQISVVTTIAVPNLHLSKPVRNKSHCDNDDLDVVHPFQHYLSHINIGLDKSG